MAYHFYASFKGTRQGQIKGGTASRHREDKWSEVLAFEMGSEKPVDVSVGLVSGKRQHGALQISRETDSASPSLYQAATDAFRPSFPGIGGSTGSSGGSSSGNGKHGAISITREVDSASPQLLQACVTNEILSEVIIEVSGRVISGTEQVFRRVTLTNAVIVNVRHRVGEDIARRRVVSDFVLMCGGVRDEPVSGG